ncbi:MAG: DUF2946 family protein [Bacteroidota bacterium]
MSRPLSASVLLAVTLLGTVVAPAVHWAGHCHDEHEALQEVADATPHASEPEADAHAGACPECANLQKVHGAEAQALPFYAAVVGVERDASPPEAPAARSDIATPEERGPPAV